MQIRFEENLIAKRADGFHDNGVMSLRKFFAVALGLALSHPSAFARKPHVLFIAADDLKPALGCYGDQLARTPNIDRLAARGIRFDAAYANQAVCAPSRNALLTGLRPQTVGIYDLGTHFRKATPDAVTLPQHFKLNGYRTEALGKIFHVGHGNTEDPLSWSVPHLQANSIAYVLPESRAKDGLTREEAFFSNAAADVSKLPRGAAYESADVEDAAYPDARLADEAIRRLRAVKENPDQPVFLALGFLKPHLPFCAPKKYWDMYDPAAFKLAELRTPPEGAPKFAPTNWGELRQYSEMPQNGPLTDEQARKIIHGYYAATSYVDAQLGRVLDALDELGLAKDTVVILWGDHGWHFGDHGMWSKHSNYEQAARLPLIVSGPGIKAGSKSSGLVENVDLYPTLCEIAGLPVPPSLDGRSFAATLRDPSAPTKESVIHVFPRGELLGRAIRTSRHRLVEWKKPGAAADTAILELYDYEADPAETRNLAELQPEVVATLRKILSQHPEAKPPYRARSREARGERIVLFGNKDKDGNGSLTREEFLAGQPDPEVAPQRFTRFDSDQDGILSREEFVTMGGSVKE
jgi:iduronate 2-sulfatase